MTDKDILLIASGAHHDCTFVQQELRVLVAAAGDFSCHCAEDYAVLLDYASWPRLLITYTSNVFPDARARDALRAFVQAGGSWLALHATAAYTCFKPPAVNIGGIQLPGLTDTPDREPEFMDLLGCRFVAHLAQQPFCVTVAADHPLVRELAAFDVVDEPYILELRRKWQVLLESRYTGEAPGYVQGPWLDDVTRPQLLVRPEGDGQIAYLALGHACGPHDLRPFIDEIPRQVGPWHAPAFRDLIVRLLRWGVSKTDG